MVEGLDNSQLATLLDTFKSIDFEAFSEGPGEFLRRRMARFWGYLGAMQPDK
jgi:hypothetical protein